ncbi:MAG: substrate-binding domain-containing protein [Akkermansiaceae bacterium]|nr:substrate-binding domain-containing protein [Armatimonadota bacterium]
MSTVRWNEITESLRNLIAEGQLQPGDRLPSEKVLAAQWGVCRMTAHRAMSELEREGLVHRKRRVGTIVIPQHETKHVGKADEVVENFTSGMNPGFPTLPKGTKRVALLCFHVNDFPQADYIHGFRSSMPENYHVLLCDTENRPEREAEYLRRLSGEADAICIYPTCAVGNTPLLARIAEEGTPVICLDRVPEGLEEAVDGVVTDNYSATHESLRILAARGHTHVALLTTDARGVSSLTERRQGWRDALLSANISIADCDALLRRFPPGLGYDFDMLSQIVHDALYTLRHKSPNPPTAVLCLDDFFLSAAMEACDRMGLVVPDDFELLSFSDYPPLAARLAQNSHRISQRTREMGDLAATRLQGRLSETLTERATTVRVPAVLRLAGSSTVTPLIPQMIIAESRLQQEQYHVSTV